MFSQTAIYDLELLIKECKLDDKISIKQLLKHLTNKDLPEKRKLCLLLFIQQQTDLFINNRESVSIFLDFLPNYYKQLTTEARTLNKNNFLSSQILVTWTTITVLSPYNLEPVSKLSFVSLFDELIQLILNINNIDNCVLRSVACDCLVELELAFPKLLSSMLETLKDIYIQEITFMHYKYALLLSTAAKHEYTIKNDSFSMSQQIISGVVSTNSNSQTLLMSPLIGNIQEKQILSLLMEQLIFLNNYQGSLIVKNVAEIILITKSVSPSILKSFVLQYKKSFDINLLHTICNLQMIFNNELFSDEIEQQLLIHIFHLAHLPLLPSAQRLLLLDWLQYYAVQHEDENGIISQMKLDYGFALKFCPTIFDGWETSMKKFIISTSLLIQTEKPSIDGETLWKFIICEYNASSNTMCRKGAASIFRFLIIFFNNFGQYFTEEVIKFVTEFFQDHSSFIFNIINFMNCLLNSNLDSALIESIWESLVESTLQTIETLNYETLPHYLILLNEVAKNASNKCCIKVISFLLALTTMNICESGTWILGNQILQICQSLLRYRDCNSIFTELSDVLHYLYTKYDDFDVRDNARFLYMILMTLSTQRIQNMFNYEISLKYQPHGDTSSALVSEMGSFGLTDRIVVIKDSPIELIVDDKNFENEFEEQHEKCCEMPENILKYYRLYIGKDECTKHVLLQARLQYVNPEINKNAENFEKLYCIDIEFEHSDSLKDLKSITVPFLEQSQRKAVTINFTPIECKPTALNASATFNTSDCATYISKLFPFSVKFQDFFLPLQTPTEFLLCKNEWRQHVFEELWSSFSKNAEQSESDCQESVHLIKMTKNNFHIILQSKLAKFVIKNGDIKNPIQVGIFLPPNNHILLKMKISDENIITQIVVDHWKILSHLNDFLLTLEN